MAYGEEDITSKENLQLLADALYGQGKLVWTASGWVSQQHGERFHTTFDPQGQNFVDVFKWLIDNRKSSVGVDIDAYTRGREGPVYSGEQMVPVMIQTAIRHAQYLKDTQMKHGVKK